MITLFGEEMIPEKMSGAPKVKTADAESGPVSSSALEGWQAEKNYYTIGEVAKLFSVKTSHIRYWTTEFALSVRTTRKGDRMYTPANIRELIAIYHLVKERGFTIAGAKAHLKENATIPETLDLRASLLRLRNILLVIRNQLL